MGVVVTEVVFDGRAPALADIADAVTRRTGLPVAATDSGPDARGDLFDLHAHLAFADAPDTRVEMSAYRPGAVAELCRQMFRETGSPIAKHVQGLNEPPGTQAVCVRGFVGQEPTLFFATILALESLGGRPRDPLDDDERQRYGTSIAPAELAERRREVRRRMWPAVVIGLVLLPILIPVWFAAFVLTMPWRIWRASRVLGRNRLSEY
jgi:hypothetical protein